MGSSKKQTVGYKYYIGMHIGLCHGPIDQLIRIDVGDKEAWPAITNTRYGIFTRWVDWEIEEYGIPIPPEAEPISSGSLFIDAPSLFGGEKREGGIEGTLDLLSGESFQPPNEYLMARLGADLVSGFRNICSVVLRQMYIGTNPYLKKWAFRVQRIHNGQDGLQQWYDEKAPIGNIGILPPTSIHFALDDSGSMAGTRAANQKLAVKGALDYIDMLIGKGLVEDLDILIRGLNSASITRRSVDNQAIIDLKAFVDTIPASGGTYFENGVSSAPAFFEGSPAEHRRVSIFTTDGNPSDSADDAGAVLLGITDIAAYGVNIDLATTTETAKLDNTPYDGVPIISSGSSDALTAIIIGALATIWDMNPAHIIRECLTNSQWGMGISSVELDEDSFTTSADTLYNESMGISILWNQQTSIDEFITHILKHIDGDLSTDNTTGKFRLKLIRDDFDEETLPVLSPANCDRIEDFQRLTVAELVNEVIVTYWDSETGNDRTVSVQDIALLQVQEGINSATINYPGFTNYSTAARVAARDLKTLSCPRASCTIYANRFAASFNKGDVFKLVWPKLGIASLIMRVTSIDVGDGVNNLVKIVCTQDTFSLPTVALISEPEIRWVDPSGPPLPVPAQISFELPYFELVMQSDQDLVDSKLDTYPDMGFNGIAGVSPSGIALNSLLHTDSGAGYTEYDICDFCPYATLVEDIGYMDTIIPITDGVDISEIALGTWAQIGTELVGIVAVSTTEMTITRGVLDTTPETHLAGDGVFFWDEFSASDMIQYAYTDTIDMKLQTVNGSGILDLNEAPISTATMDRRAIRPYPPGNVQINGEYYPEMGEGDMILTWAHRDRIQQTAPSMLIDFLYGNIGPEEGTTYRVQIDDDDGVELHSASGIDAAITTYVVASNLLAAGFLRIRIWSVRDTYESLYPFDFTMVWNGDLRIVDNGDYRITDDGSQRFVIGG